MAKYTAIHRAATLLCGTGKKEKEKNHAAAFLTCHMRSSDDTGLA